MSVLLNAATDAAEHLSYAVIDIVAANDRLTAVINAKRRRET